MTPTFLESIEEVRRCWRNLIREIALVFASFTWIEYLVTGALLAVIMTALILLRSCAGDL